MKQKVMKLVILLLCVVTVVSSGTRSESASKSTSYTFSLSTESNELEVVDDAFLPVGAYLELGLNAAQDLDVKNGLVYIADTNNKRVLILDPARSAVREIGVGILSKPQGVAADEDGRIYVADYANQAVYRFVHKL